MHTYYPKNEQDRLHYRDCEQLKKIISKDPQNVIAIMWLQRWEEGKQWFMYLI